MITRLAAKWSARDFAAYLKGLLEDKTGAVIPPMRVTEMAYERLLQAFDGNRELLVLATDRMVETIPEMAASPSRWLTVRVVERAVLELGGFGLPWKYLYLKRFAASPAEASYWDYWLSVLDDSESAEADSQATIGDVRYRNWAAVKRVAIGRLDDAAKVIAGRAAQAEDGMLQEYFTAADTVKPGPNILRAVREAHASS